MTEDPDFSIDDIRQERLRREAEWYRSEEGFLDFARDCGAAPDAQFQPHGRLCQSMVHWNGTPDPDNLERLIYKWKMTLWPRGSFKSQVFNVAHVCWLIAKDPNLRILVASETDKQAKEFVAKAMQIIDSQWFRDRFGIHRGKDWKEGSGSFKSALRTLKHIKEPTLQATGVGAVRTGMHWDFVFMDDVCSQENTRTPESIESLWYWFGETLAQLDPGCRLFVIGTLHHYADIYCRIKKDPRMRELFEMSIYGWADPLVDPESNEPTTLFFPGRLTRKFVAQQKRILPPRLYSCFYENRPQSEEQQLFSPSYFRVIPDQDIPRQVWSYILTDFAFTAEDKKKDRPDRSAFWVIALDCNRVAYVLDIVVGRWRPSDSCRIVCDLWTRYQHWNVKAVTVEKGAHDELLSSLFEEIRRQTFIMPRFQLIGGRSQEIKDMRIEASEPRWRRGDIYIAQSVRDQWRKWKPMFDEMTEWPFSANDDIPDAQSDLDKRDQDGKLYCPGPPVGWQSNAVSIKPPPMVNGRFNPEANYPADEFHKVQQKGNELWQTKSSGADQGDSLFRQRVPDAPSIFRRQ